MSTTTKTTIGTNTAEYSGIDDPSVTLRADEQGPPRKPGQRPVSKIQLGRVQAAIWRNIDEKGRPWYTTTIERRFKVEGSDDWKSSNGFSRDELLTLGKAANLANTRVHELQQRDKRHGIVDEMPEGIAADVGESLSR